MSATPAQQLMDFPLRGSHLIEASAGTGKTWTLSALYVRLVLGHGNQELAPPRALLPQDVLVMTFTRAATRELCERIRSRLTEASRFFRNLCETQDDFLQALRHEYPDGEAREEAAHRLALAAQSLDDAAIFTIDAWCQRMLREHAFDSGSLFEENLIADEAALRLQAVQDYWRQQFYPMDATLLSEVLEVWPDVQALDQDMQALMAVPLPEGPSGTLAQVFAATCDQRQAQLQALRLGWDVRADRLLDWIDAQLEHHRSRWDVRKLSARHCASWLGELKAWAQGDDEPQVLRKAMKTGWERLTSGGLRECLRPGQAFMAWPPEVLAFEDLQTALQDLPDPARLARLHARTQVQRRMLELKRQSGLYGFADMQQRLADALDEPDTGEGLAQRLRQQFPVAMIDEFQDTSPLQLRLFDRIYRTAENLQDSALLLIGDPKQSIYAFRGADIHSYLAARRATAGRHHVLTTNYRSTEAMVAVVNRWFQLVPDPFACRSDEDDPLPFVPVRAHGRVEKLCTGHEPVPALTLVHEDTLRSPRDALARLSALCAEQILGWLHDPQTRFVQPGVDDRRLQPRDIAVLVRTGKEADAVRQALQARGLPSVYLSDRDSVFASHEARDLCLWLGGVAEPQDMRRVRAALGTATVGLSIEELYILATDEEALDRRAEQMRELRQTWQRQGVLAMLRQSLHLLQLAGRWLARPDGERRLTNVLHLAELLQTASSTIDGEQGLIRWLAQQIEQAHAGVPTGIEEQTVRLESDEDLVKVVTIHASKGLEYPVVCLPFAHSHRSLQGRSPAVLQREDGHGQRHWTLDFDREDTRLADRERLREDLRLWYVALTRARHALWIGWSPVRMGSSPSCRNHLSAAGHLLSGGLPTEAGDWLPRLQELQADPQGRPLPVRLQAAPREVPLTIWQGPVRHTASGQALLCSTAIDKSWAIASFSRLARDLPDAPVARLVAPRPADDEPEQEGMPEAIPAAARSPWHRFPKGPNAGHFLHELLEWLAGERFALDPPRAERLRLRCERAGHGDDAEGLLQWLARVAGQPLHGPQVPLQALQNLLPEMEFWLPAARLHAGEVDALCRQHLLPGLDRPSLPGTQLHGMLMGFADLVFEHEGRYWVLDYKSSHLGPDDAAYTAERLEAAMVRHRYDVQAALYLLALHRLLRARLGPAYDPGRQLGGAVYLFLRGIDGPARGCCTLQAPLELLQGLDAMLGVPEEA